MKRSLKFFLIRTFSLLTILITINPYASDSKEKYLTEKRINKNNTTHKLYDISNKNISKIKWSHIQNTKDKEENYWEKINLNDYKSLIQKYKDYELVEEIELNTLNRSIVFDNTRVGPDISWLVPPGLSWSETFFIDGSIRGHNRREDGESFWGFNKGDAVGQFYFQPIHTKRNSYGINLGVRSVYEGSRTGGQTPFGEGLSLGFRSDRAFSNTSGMAIGAEQLIHFDNGTDTGRDIYITFTKAWWRNKNKSTQFPLDIATAGFATGKMAEGNIKGLCSDLFGGAGIETATQRRLCWAPVFTLSRVFNESFSSFFEYNSKWFLLGTSFAPSQNIPLRGTFAVQISDHIDNYQINDVESLKWVFRVSLGF